MTPLLDLAGAIRLKSCSSTQEIARRLALDGASEGTVVIAGAQTAGRGRSERSWHSPPGLGLWMSFLLRPRVGSADWPALTALTALATAEAIEGLHPPAPLWSCAIKWPNDLYGLRGKLAGILAETAGSAVVIGLGLNLGQLVEDFPPDLRERASSLRREGFEPVPSAESAARAVNDRLTAGYRAFQNDDRAFLREGLRQRFFLRDAHVCLAWPGGGAEGVAVDLGPAGELILQTAEGPSAFVAGEVAEWSRRDGGAPGGNGPA